jgi:hypothetical protein
VSGTDAKAPDPFFELAPGIDLTKLPLTPEEGFLCSRFTGRRVSLGDLARETGLPGVKVKAAVEKLMKLGAITLVTGIRAPAPTRVRDPYEGMIFAPGDLADGKDLTEEQKKRILFIEAKLDDWSHYALLGLKRSATGAEIKSGYFKASKEFHPDAFFRKDLGKYAERVDRIFRAMKACYDVLSKPMTRAAYDETLVGELTPEELAELEAIADEKKREAEIKARLARAEEARKQQRLRWNPMAQRLAKAREMFRLAEGARKEGKHEEAANLARLACSYDEALTVRAEPIILEADAARCAALTKKVHAALQYGDKSMEADIHKAAESAAELAEAVRRAPLLLDVAKAMQAIKRPQRAFKLATLAAELDDRMVPAWTIVAEVALAESKFALAKRAVDRWLSLEPTNARAKELAKDIAKAAKR